MVRKDDLRTESEMTFVEKEECKYVKACKALGQLETPEDNFLHFREKGRPTRRKPADSFKPDGDFNTPEKPGYKPAESWPRQLLYSWKTWF